VRRILRGRTEPDAKGRDATVRQPVGPMEGEVRLARQGGSGANGRLIMLGTNNLPADVSPVDGKRHDGDAVAKMEGGRHLFVA